MENRILFVANEKLDAIKAAHQSRRDVFLAEIDGNLIRTEEDYVRKMRAVFCVPYKSSNHRFEYYCDFMTDLLWIEQPNIVLLIKNYDRLLDKDLRTKEWVMKDFIEALLPWWAGDVVGHMVGGEPRGFNIYISR